jgi:hypothetical protein
MLFVMLKKTLLFIILLFAVSNAFSIDIKLYDIENSASNLKNIPPSAIASKLNEQADLGIEMINSGELNQLINAGNTADINKMADFLENERKALGTKISSSQAQNVDNTIVALRNLANGVDDLISSFKTHTGINAIKAVDDNLLNTVKGWQGSGSYPGVDNWTIVEIPAGTKVYGGLPGQSEFYSVEKSLLDVNYNKADYWDGLQVSPHPQFGFRPKVGEYTTNQTIKVAISKTLANPQHGTGGAWQVFVNDFSDNLTFVKEITLQ